MSRTEQANELDIVIIGAGVSGLTCGVMFVEDAGLQCGHSGAGYTLSWGGAEEVVDSARESVAGRRVER
jgi:ribulose 1,5-bisphosphate synthetase/thiazole synthase